MANPYDRIIKSPAEKRADDFRKSIEPAPADSTPDVDDLMRMEYQEGPVGTGTSGFVMPGETAGTILQEDGSGFRVPQDAFQQALTSKQQDQFFGQYPIEPETPPEPTWQEKLTDPGELAKAALDLPHVPYVSPVAADVRDKIFDAFNFTAEMPATIMGGLQNVAGEIAGQEGEDFYGKWYAGGWLPWVDDKTGLANTVLEDIYTAPEGEYESLGDIYQKIIDTHEARPVKEQIFTGLISPDIVIPVGGIASKLLRGLKIGGKVAKELVKQSETLPLDPSSVYYRFVDETLESGQRQVVIVSNAYPDGRRVTVGSSPEAQAALDAAMEQVSGNYKILPGNANRAEVAEAAARLDLAETGLRPNVRAFENVRQGRGYMDQRFIDKDAPAFSVSGVTPEERLGIIESFWRSMPKELVGLGDERLPTDAFDQTKYIAPGKAVVGIKAVVDEDVSKVAGMDLVDWAKIQRMNLRTLAGVIRDKWKTDAPGIRKQAAKEVGIKLGEEQSSALSRVQRYLDMDDDLLARHHIAHMRQPGVQIKGGFKVGPVVRKVNPPALVPDLFGDRELLHIVDGDDPFGAVVAALEIRKVGKASGTEVVAFYPTAAGGGPGMFQRTGIQQILRQIGDLYPNLSNMDFAGRFAREGNTADEFVGTAQQSMAQRLSDTNISDDVADALNASYPRASTVDINRITESGIADKLAAYGYLPKPTIEGYTHTLADRINEARGMASLSPWEQAALATKMWPIAPGELLYDMAEYGSHNILFDQPGLANKIAESIPGSGKVLGAWNRVQLEASDPVKFVGHEVQLYKEMEHARVRTAVMAWKAAAYKSLGFRHIRSTQDALMNRKGVWRAEDVAGYRPDLVEGNPLHGTIDDILKDADEVKAGRRVPSDPGDVLPPGKERQVYYLTEEQQKHIDMAQNMMEQNLRRNQEIGVKVDAIAENYWHRMILRGPADKSAALFNRIWSTIEGRAAPPGSSRSYQFDRAFDDLDAALKEDFVWESDPALRMLARLDAGVDTYAHKQAYDKVLGLKSADGKPFLTRKERLEWEGHTEWKVSGPKAVVGSLKLARSNRVEARKLYKSDPNPTTELLLRKADAQFITAYREYRAASALADKNYFEYAINGKINDQALVDDILKNVHIPQIQTARTLKKGAAPLTDPISQGFTEVAQLFRAMMTNVDLAAMGIQGQVLLYRDPMSWFRAVGESIRAIVREPDAYVARNREFMDEGQNLGAIMRPTEHMFDRTGLASIPTRLPLFGPAFRAFQRSFEWFIIIGQTELYKTMRTRVYKGAARRDEFIPLDSEEALMAMVDYGKSIRKTLGTESHAILGIRPTQQTLESTVAFAARFMRANMGLIALALRPTRGADSIEAKRALLTLVAGATAFTLGIHYQQTGRAPNFHDPYAADWFQFPIGKTYFNVMGPLYTYFRTIARASQAMAEGDEAKAAQQIKYFLDSRAGLPIRAMGVTADMMATGESRTIGGELIEPSLSGAAAFSEQFVMPLAISGVSEALSQGRWEATVTEVFGMTGRASPNAQMDILFQQHIRDPQNDMYQVRARLGVEAGNTWYDASPAEKDWMNNTYPELADAILKGGRGDYGDAAREWDIQNAKYIGQQNELAAKLHKPVDQSGLAKGDRPMDGAMYRERLEDIQNSRWVEHQKTTNDYGLFEEEREAKNEFEQGMIDYHAVFDGSKDATGNIQWGLFDELFEEYEDTHTPEVLQYVEINTGINNDSTAKQLRDDKRALREVWEYKEKVAEELPLDQRIAYQQYKNMGVTGQRQTSGGILGLLQYVNGRTKEWLLNREREGDATAGYLEEKLVYWGYESAPVTIAGINLLKDLNDEMGYSQRVQDPELRRPEVYQGQGDTFATNSPAEDMEPAPQWLQSIRSGR